MSSGNYHVRRDVAIPLSEGAVSTADVYLPEGAGRWPVLLTRTPYGKGDVFQSQFILNMQFADAVGAGFAVVVQDTRGRGGSTGEFTPFVDEEADAVATLDWITAQDFSDGRVAMFGASYVGATQWLAAMSGHPALASIAPVLTSPDFRCEWVRSGGAFQLSFQFQWLIEALGEDDIAHRAWPDDASSESAMQTLHSMRADPDAAFARLPLLDERLAELAPYLVCWLRDEDEYWEQADPVRRLPMLHIPALHVLGWNDIFAAGALRAFERATAAGAPAAQHQHLVAGPWAHGNMSDWQGDCWHGYGASAQAVGLQRMQLELARAAVDGRPADLPRVLYFTTGIDKWQTSEVWPLSDVADRRWEISADGRLISNGDVATEGSVCFRSDPDDPVPSVGGPSFLPGVLQGRNSAHKLQADVESRDDVVVFTSGPLEEDLHVVGTPVVELQVSADCPSADWAVRLCDVSPHEQSLGITDGMLRTARCAGNEPLLARIRLGPTSHVFRAGHRLRLQVAGSNHPRFDVNPHCAVPAALATPADRAIAIQTIVVDTLRPSSVVLPVRSGRE